MSAGARWRPTLWRRWVPGSTARSKVMQVWFPGAHSDVGGGYPAAKLGRLFDTDVVIGGGDGGFVRHGIGDGVAKLVGDHVDFAGVENDGGLVGIVRVVVPRRADFIAEIRDGLDAHVALHGAPVGVELLLELVVQLGGEAHAKGEGDGGKEHRKEHRVADGEAEAKTAKEAAEIALADHITPAERRPGRRSCRPPSPGVRSCSRCRARSV